MTSISITIKDTNARRLEQLADNLDRSRSWVVNDAIEQYLAHHAWMDEQTEAAIADIDAGGEMIPHEVVMDRADQRAKDRRK